jgi:hypothetical protein
MKQENKITLSLKEKRQYLLYLALLYVVAIVILIWVIFRNSSNPFESVSIIESAYLKRAREFDEKKKYALELFDSTFESITALQNAPMNVVIEADIKSQLKELNDLSNRTGLHDTRFVSFGQMALFLTNYFEDILILKQKQANIQQFQNQLNDCEIGYKEGEVLMNQLKAAQAAKVN